MVTAPGTQESGQEPTPNTLPDNQDAPQDTAGEHPKPDDEAEAMEEAQKEGAEQRKEGGYQ